MVGSAARGVSDKCRLSLVLESRSEVHGGGKRQAACNEKQMSFAVELRSFDSSQNRLKQRVIAAIVQPNVQNKILQTLLPPLREDLLKERLDRLLFVIRHLIVLHIQHAVFNEVADD